MNIVRKVVTLWKEYFVPMTGIEEIVRAARERLGIERLNAVQEAMAAASGHGGDIVLYAPTGSGKTLAFALVLLQTLRPDREEVQAVVIAPSRELVLQIHDVLQRLAAGLRVVCCYGGHDVRTEQRSLAVTPHVVVATPGRLLDHVKRGHVSLAAASMLVLDEFDKSLELGFGDEMSQLLHGMPRLSRRILTSATVMENVPPFVRLRNPEVLNLLDAPSAPSGRVTVWRVESPTADKLDTLCALLLRVEAGKVMVFVNYREAVERVRQYLVRRHIVAGGYHGALEQDDREKVLAAFENGSLPVLVTTDLGARGLDIEAVEHVVHYHLPLTEAVYTHRTGRTARVDALGNSYLIIGPDEELPPFVATARHFDVKAPTLRHQVVPTMVTLYFQSGKKEKISRGDIVGYLVAAGEIPASQVGRIVVKDHYALAAVPRAVVRDALPRLQQARLKGRRVRVSPLNV